MPGTSGWPSASFRPSSVSAIALGWPGRLMMRHWSRTTATWRERMAVGTKRRLIWRICSPKPGISLCATASVASGVTSRRAGPVPPVVSTRLQPSLTSAISVALMRSCSSGIRRGSKVRGFFSARVSQSCSAGRPLSSYTPLLARSLMETMPIFTGSSVKTSLIAFFRPIVRFGFLAGGAGDLRAYQCEQFAVGAALAGCQALRHGGVAFGGGILACLTDQGAQLLDVGGGIEVDPLGLGAVLRDQAVAPLLGLVQGELFFGRAAALFIQCVAYGLDHLGFKLAHELADKLHLAALAFEVGDAPGLPQGLLQLVGQGQAVEQVRAQGQQFFAQLLQFVALALEIGAAGV